MQTTTDRIREIIRDKGLKQNAVAEKSGFSPKAFNDLLMGRKTFKVEYITPICEALGVTPNDIYGFTPHNIHPTA